MNHKEVVATLKELADGVRMVCARARAHSQSDMQFSQAREDYFKPPLFTRNEQDMERLGKARSEEMLATTKQEQPTPQKSLYVWYVPWDFIARAKLFVLSFIDNNDGPAVWLNFQKNVQLTRSDYNNYF